MERKAIILVASLFVGAVGGMAYLEVKRAGLERANADLAARGEGLQRQVDTAAALEKALRAEAAQQAQRIEQAEQQVAHAQQRVAQVQSEIAAIRNPPEDKPTCFDSDAKYGADAIYVRGSLRSGNSTSSDHCRLGQLVEFSCVENPRGSGRFIRDAAIADCPSGSRCVEGECLR